MSETQTILPVEDAMWHAEQARRYRLLHMGLQPLVSLFDAPGARPTHRALPPDVPTDNQSTRTETATSFKALLDAVSDKEPGHKGVAQAEITEAQSGRATSSQTTPRLTASDPATPIDATFSVVIFHACGWLWVEGLKDGLLRQEQILLAQAMARAISGQTTQVNAQWQQFDWPMVDNDNLARDHETGIHMLRGLLSRMMKEHAVTGTILMGSHVVVETALQHVQATIPSTLDMLTDPSKKADAWRILRPLRVPRS